MKTTYLLSLEVDAVARACQRALENRFPMERFESGRQHGVLGVRLVTEGYVDLDSPRMIELRAFAAGFAIARLGD